MRKLYSLVLIAAGLLIGTNTWAANVAQIGTQTYTTLADAFNAVGPGETATIELLDDCNISAAIEIGKATTDEAGRTITLDFKGHKVTSTKATMINLYRGALYLTTSVPGEEVGLYNTNNSKHRTVQVFGSILKNCNPRTAAIADLYSYLYIGAGVNIVSDGEKNANGGIAVTFYPASGQVWNGINDKGCRIYKTVTPDPRGVANGVRIDVYGKIKGSLYAMQSNGELAAPDDVYNYGPAGADASQYFQANKETFYGTTNVEINPGDTAYAPYIYIAENAELSNISGKGEALTAGQVALYTSGYARWHVEGNCNGTTGLYMKSGQVDLNGATITSTATVATEITNQTIGVNGGGNAIVVESNDHYSGHIGLTIEENTNVNTNAENGTALFETIATGSNTEVEHITIEGGTLSGGNGGNAIVISDQTAEEGNVTVYGGTDIEGSVTVGEETTAEAIAAIFADGVYPTVDPVTGDVTINPGYSVKLNAYGYATFSATKAVKLPAGLTAYGATSMGTEYLNMTSLATEGQTIPAETGVFFSGEANTTVTLSISEESAVSVGTNLWKPAAAWTAGVAQENAYVLSGNQLYLYTKTAAIPSNKAYLQLPANAGAPARISLRFNQTEQTTAVENVALEADKAVKFVGEDGKLYIRRGEAVYTVQGQLVK